MKYFDSLEPEEKIKILKSVLACSAAMNWVSFMAIRYQEYRYERIKKHDALLYKTVEDLADRCMNNGMTNLVHETKEAVQFDWIIHKERMD